MLNFIGRRELKASLYYAAMESAINKELVIGDYSYRVQSTPLREGVYLMAELTAKTDGVVIDFESQNTNLVVSTSFSGFAIREIGKTRPIDATCRGITTLDRLYTKLMRLRDFNTKYTLDIGGVKV